MRKTNHDGLFVSQEDIKDRLDAAKKDQTQVTQSEDPNAAGVVDETVLVSPEAGNAAPSTVQQQVEDSQAIAEAGNGGVATAGQPMEGVVAINKEVPSEANNPVVQAVAEQTEAPLGPFDQAISEIFEQARNSPEEGSPVQAGVDVSPAAPGTDNLTGVEASPVVEQGQTNPTPAETVYPSGDTVPAGATDKLVSFFGGRDAKFLATLEDTATAHEQFPALAKAHKEVFYEGDRPRTVAEVIQFVQGQGDQVAPEGQTVPGESAVAQVVDEIAATDSALTGELAGQQNVQDQEAALQNTETVQPQVGADAAQAPGATPDVAPTADEANAIASTAAANAQEVAATTQAEEQSAAIDTLEQDSQVEQAQAADQVPSETGGVDNMDPSAGETPAPVDNPPTPDEAAAVAAEPNTQDQAETPEVPPPAPAQAVEPAGPEQEPVVEPAPEEQAADTDTPPADGEDAPAAAEGTETNETDPVQDIPADVESPAGAEGEPGASGGENAEVQAADAAADGGEAPEATTAPDVEVDTAASGGDADAGGLEPEVLTQGNEDPAGETSTDPDSPSMPAPVNADVPSEDAAPGTDNSEPAAVETPEDPALTEDTPPVGGETLEVEPTVEPAPTEAEPAATPPEAATEVPSGTEEVAPAGDVVPTETAPEAAAVPEIPAPGSEEAEAAIAQTDAIVGTNAEAESVPDAVTGDGFGDGPLTPEQVESILDSGRPAEEIVQVMREKGIQGADVTPPADPNAPAPLADETTPTNPEAPVGEVPTDSANLNGDPAPVPPQDGETSEPTADEAGKEDPEVSINEKNDSLDATEQQVNDVDAMIDEAAAVSTRMGEVADIVADTLDDVEKGDGKGKGMDEKTANLVSIATEALCARAGMTMTKSKAVSLESFSDEDRARHVTKIALENLQTDARRVFDAIVAAIKLSIRWMIDFLRETFELQGILRRQLVQLKAKAEMSKVTTTPNDLIDAEKFASSLVMDGKLPIALNDEILQYGALMREAMNEITAWGQEVGKRLEIGTQGKATGTSAFRAPVLRAANIDLPASQSRSYGVYDTSARVTRTDELLGGKVILNVQTDGVKYESNDSSGRKSSTYTGETFIGEEKFGINLVDRNEGNGNGKIPEKVPALIPAAIVELCDATIKLLDDVDAVKKDSNKLKEAKDHFAKAIEQVSIKAKKLNDNTQGASDLIVVKAALRAIDIPTGALVRHALRIANSAFLYGRASLEAQLGKK